MASLEKLFEAAKAIASGPGSAANRLSRLIADLRDIAFSLGSACASGSGRVSSARAALSGAGPATSIWKSCTQKP